jgi:formylglycine-generating enzyme required for sulfatase activity
MKISSWSRVGLIATALLLGASVTYAQGDELLVTEVYAEQIQGLTGLVIVTYNLETVNNVPVVVTLFLSTDGGASYPILCQSVTGDVGSNVLPGASRYIIWNAVVDIPDVISDNCRLRVTADDGLDNFVYIPGGTFTMGSPTDEPGRDDNEIQHQVTLTHGFYVQTTEVTNQQYMELAQWAYDHGHVIVMSYELRDNFDGSTQILMSADTELREISFSNGVFSCIRPNHPVKYVTWYGSAAYCDWLSLQQGLPRAYDHATWQCNGGNPYTAAGYRLPTEAEYEYACRAGSTTAFANGPITQLFCSPIDPNLDVMGWYCGNASDWTRLVAQKLPNAWGLYDMHGNLYERCNDWYGAYGGAVTDPVGPDGGSFARVFRGGSWGEIAQRCRSAFRNRIFPGNADASLGFRPVRSSG